MAKLMAVTLSVTRNVERMRYLAIGLAREAHASDANVPLLQKLFIQSRRAEKLELVLRRKLADVG